MSKYKIAVYGICKNEEKFVDRWVKSMSEADHIFVLDTGSSDDSIQLLKDLGVTVSEACISPWRFDVARNMSLDMVPGDYDICVCTDLDEVFEKGWRDKLEETWNDDCTRCSYTYNWSLDSENRPVVSFLYEKIHCRHGFSWIYPVHEILKYDGIDKYVSCPSIVLNHYPDVSKSRGSYLGLLELSINEDPFNDRNMHYLGREYMYYGRWNDSIDTLIKHLNLDNSTWDQERCASMRFIARCYKNMDRFYEAKLWGILAIDEAPYLREPYVEMAMVCFSDHDYSNTIDYCNKAIDINYDNKTYINESFCYDETVYDLISLSYFYLEDIDSSLKYIDMALSINPKNERIINNKSIILELKKND